MLEYPLTEHESKYQCLAETLGIDALKKLIRIPREKIQAALGEGDIYLNRWGLEPWDIMAGMKPWQAEMRRSDWPGFRLRISARDHSLPWHKVPQLSLAERACVLKHVARYYY